MIKRPLVYLLECEKLNVNLQEISGTWQAAMMTSTKIPVRSALIRDEIFWRNINIYLHLQSFPVYIRNESFGPNKLVTQGKYRGCWDIRNHDMINAYSMYWVVPEYNCYSPKLWASWWNGEQYRIYYEIHIVPYILNTVPFLGMEFFVFYRLICELWTDSRRLSTGA